MIRMVTPVLQRYNGTRTMDIEEKIRAHFQDHMNNHFSSEGSSVMGGQIFGASGDITSPMIELRGSTTLFEGLQSIATLTGCYIISKDGDVQQSYSLVTSFQSNGQLVVGRVVGPLIAGSDVQARVGFCKFHGDGAS